MTREYKIDCIKKAEARYPVEDILSGESNIEMSSSMRIGYADALMDMEDPWIDVNEKLPELYQSVAFVVNNSRDHNGKVYGGSYTGSNRCPNEFSTPGIGFSASHWTPLPEPPNLNKKEDSSDTDKRSVATSAQ